MLLNNTDVAVPVPPALETFLSLRRCSRCLRSTHHTQRVTREPSPPLYEVGPVLIPSAGEATGGGANERAWSRAAEESEAGA